MLVPVNSSDWRTSLGEKAVSRNCRWQRSRSVFFNRLVIALLEVITRIRLPFDAMCPVVDFSDLT
jgi:hypothetical protein